MTLKNTLTRIMAAPALRLREHKSSIYLQIAVFLLALIVPLLQILRSPLSFLTGFPVASFAFIPLALIAVIGFFLEFKTLKESIKSNWSFLLFFVYASISLIWSLDRVRGAMFIVTLACSFFASGVYRHSALKEKLFQGYVAGITIANLVMIFIFVSRGIGNLSLSTRFAYIRGSLGPVGTYFSTYVDPNSWALFQLLSLVIILLWINRRRADFQLYLLAGFQIWMIWATQSRGMILAMLFVIIGSFLLLKKRLSISVAPMLFVLILGITTLTQMLFSVSAPDLPSVSAPDLPSVSAPDLPSVSAPDLPSGIHFYIPQERVLAVGDLVIAAQISRNFIWMPSVEGFLSSPAVLLFGAGSGSSEIFTGQSMGLNHIVSPHNVFLSLLFEFGILGFILFCAFFFRIMFILWKYQRETILISLPFVFGGMSISVQTLPPFIMALSLIMAAQNNEK